MNFTKVKLDINLKIFKQFIKFGVVGVFGSSLNFIIFFIMFNILNLNYIFSGILGFIAPIPIVFFINSMWSFNYKFYNYNRLKVYFILNIITLLCHIFLLIFLKSIIGWQEEICQLSGILVSAIVNFTLLKLFLFDKK